MGVVIDTSALIALERSDHGLESLPLNLGREPGVIPAIVYAELVAGVLLATRPEQAARRRARIEALASRIPIVEFDRSIGDRWAEVFAKLTLAGTMIPANDIQVASTALSLDFTVLLGPKGDAHYAKVPDLRIARL